MTRNFKDLQGKMDPASRADNLRAVHEEIRRMALDELRSAQRLTQADLAEMLDIPQSSISRLERRTDMYLSTLRDYVHALGGVLQIQAVFPDAGAVAIDRFGDYQDRSYIVEARKESGGTYRLNTRPLDGGGLPYATKALKLHAFTRTLKALHIPQAQIAAIRKSLDESPSTEIGGRLARRVFSEPDLVSAGFESQIDG